MKKIIVSILVMGWLLTTSIVSVNAISGDDGVALLWRNSEDVGLSRGSSIFCSYINDDTTPDVLVNHSALYGNNGDLIWNTGAGEICGVGDINNDGIDEIFTKEEDLGSHPNAYSMLYCLNGADGTIIWELYLESALIFHISVGDLLGDELNEVIVGTGDWIYRNNNYIYCLEGISGDIIWQKLAGDYVQCTEIADVDADGENEVIAGTRINDPRVYCLDGENGDVIWEFVQPPEPGVDFRTLCIDDLNDDPYREILVEMYWGVNVFGICCLSGNNGSILWTWDSGPTGSFQSILTSDLIDCYPGNEIIVSGVWGIYCLYGGNDPPLGVREIWHFVDGQSENDYVMSAAIGDLDKDGLLDVAAITFQGLGENGYVFALNGQDGERLWKYEDCGTMNCHAIICSDLTGDGYPEVIAKDDFYVCTFLSFDGAPPFKPIISGEANGNAGTWYDYTFSADDPDGDDIYLWIDWGDDTVEQDGWIGPYASGEEVTINHSWSEQGTYEIRAKAKDTRGAESDWSDPFPITMPTNQISAKSVAVMKSIQTMPSPTMNGMKLL